MKASPEDHDERDQIEWEKFEPAISFKALAWGAGLTVAVIALLIKVYSLFHK